MATRVNSIQELLQALKDGAYAVVIHRPATRRALDEIVRALGAVSRNGVFADYRDIRYDPTASHSLASSREAHPLHMDGTFMAEPPLFFLLQALQTDISYAGMGLFLPVDDILAKMPPSIRDILGTEPVIYRRSRGAEGGADTHQGPILYTAPDGKPALRWRYDAYVRPEIPASLPAHRAAQLEEAVQWLHATIHSSSLTALLYRQGDIAVIRNTRCLHGRTELSGTRRHMVRVWLTAIRPELLVG
jgi:alpha-ketoglutarate-dependent taurine dioxygenase